MNLPVDSTNEELNKLFSSILRGLSLNEDDILEICEITVYKDFGTGECLVEASERTSYVGLILTGIVRGFYLDQDGRDITKCFSLEGEWCCSYSYLTDEPSPFYIEALEKTEIAAIDIDKLRELIKKFPSFGEAAESLLRESFVESEKRVLTFAGMEAKDRYKLLLSEKPELCKRVKQEYIASYLGITESSFSRLKKSM